MTKIVLVTGASRGIGFEIAKTMAEKSFTVIGTATTSSGADRISKKFLDLGLNVVGKELDITNELSIKNLLNDMKKSCGMPDILVNNAGITKDNISLRLSQQDWDDVLLTNLSSIFKISKLCLRHMMKKKWGRIISIGSVVGTSGNPGQANYCAAKAGLIGFSKSLAKEVASRNITVNVVSPGFVKTDMTEKLTEEQKDGIIKMVPMSRMCTPSEIAHSVNFLAENGASYITGHTLHVNGGMYMA